MEEKELWIDCLNCKNKCCSWKNSLPFPFFVSQEEASKIKEEYGLDIEKSKNTQPCNLFIDKKCSIYKIRPVDCQLFPFDVHKIDGKFCWIIWNGPCAITKKLNKEDYLGFFEKNIIPYFKQHLEQYNNFRCEELLNNYKFEILREINLPS